MENPLAHTVHSVYSGQEVIQFVKYCAGIDDGTAYLVSPCQLIVLPPIPKDRIRNVEWSLLMPSTVMSYPHKNKKNTTNPHKNKKNTKKHYWPGWIRWKMEAGGRLLQIRPVNKRRYLLFLASQCRHGGDSDADVKSPSSGLNRGRVHHFG